MNNYNNEKEIINDITSFKIAYILSIIFLNHNKIKELFCIGSEIEKNHSYKNSTHINNILNILKQQVLFKIISPLFFGLKFYCYFIYYNFNIYIFLYNEKV